MDAVMEDLELFPEQETLNPFDPANDEDMEADEDEPFLPASHNMEIDLTHSDDNAESPPPQKRPTEIDDISSSTKRFKSDGEVPLRASSPINSAGSSLGRGSPRLDSSPLVQSLPKLEIPPPAALTPAFPTKQEEHSLNVMSNEYADTKPVIADNTTPGEVKEDTSSVNAEGASSVSDEVGEAQDVKARFDSHAPTQQTQPKAEGTAAASTTSPLQRSFKACLLCRSKKGTVVLCVGCWIPVHSACIQGKKYCGSCTIALTSRTADDVTPEDPKLIAIVKGLGYMNSITSNPNQFKLVGHVASLHLYELATIAPLQIKAHAQKFIPQYSQQWLAAKLLEVKSADKLSTKDITNSIVGLFGLKKSNLSNALVDAIQEHANHYSVVDFLGWDPKSETPVTKYSNLCGGCGLRILRSQPKCLACNRSLVFPSKFEGFRASVIVAYHAEQVGISIGCSLLQVFAHWPVLRKAYIKAANTNYDQALCSDQWKMICSILDILSMHGTRRLPRQLLDTEFSILSNQDLLRRWMVSGNLDLFGTALYCLQLFPPTTEISSLVDAWQAILLQKQHPTAGSWGYQDAVFPFVDILRYKSTYSCIKALMPMRFHGFGPSHVDFWAYLQEWARQKAIPCGVVTSSRRFGNLRDLYRSQVISEDDSNPLHAAVQMHLKGRKQMPQAGHVVRVSSGWKRYTCDVWDKPTLDAAGNALTMNDLSIFDGLKFEDGEVIDLSNAGGMLDDGDGGDVVEDDDDEEETKEEW
ncbi:Aste57867_22318 [Aphanomyces stellatus]|uniref:Aste57867_22318 protein n=1 Tax=Aphanomyces stellatus TaxID=120398 RepID=A0A485LL90_9STRA|nr:hypothetical protein As57867_022248 [Aphanomyces stellatus]VFT98982.1 Aste57867_22318 [Aphanomyces stellatus]